MECSHVPGADITAGSAVRLFPGGWNEISFDAGRPFREVVNEAAFVLPAGINPCAYVELDVEAVGCREFVLRVCGDGVEQSLPVSHRRQLTLVLPLRLKGESQYVLRASANFRIFRLANRADIVTLQSGVDLLAGWDAMTEENGERRRVARNGAALRLHAARECPVLLADMDPGTAPAAAGLRIDLRCEAGETLFTTGIRSRQVVLMRLPIGEGSSGPFTLHYDWIGRPAPGPPILRAYRFALT